MLSKGESQPPVADQVAGVLSFHAHPLLHTL